MTSLDKNDLLAKLGLQMQPSVGYSVLTTIGPFALGIMVGAAVALMLAPKTGRELRQDLNKKLGRDGFAGRSEVKLGTGFESDRKPV